MSKKIHIGPHTRTEEPDPHPAAGTFDREINLRGIAYTVIGLVAIAVAVHLLIWGLIKGFNRFDTKRERAPSPLVESNKQPPPPGPQLQRAPELDLLKMRQEEDLKLGGAGWIDQRQGIVRVPIGVAMEIVAGRGLGPEVVGGTPGRFLQIPPAQQTQPAQPQAGQTPPPQERR
jgi:hypothetical protein